MNTLVIAEAGANHNRNFKLAKKLIDAAMAAKCDAIKFQTYSSETLYAKNTPDFGEYKDINKLIKDIELPREWQKDLKQYCEDSGIEFISTPFDERAVDELYDLGVKRFKIAGFEATDPRIVKHVASTGLPLIITAGINVNIEKMNLILEWILEENKNPDITFLHGNNAYPTPFSDINLGQIPKIIKLLDQLFFKTNFKVGLSDHTMGILIPPVAVAMGAEVVEKHFTLDRNLEGPDHPFAIEFGELKQMVRDIRNVEESLSEKVGNLSKSEKNFFNATRSVVSLRDIKKGDTITLDKITTKRPAFEDSIPAFEYYNLAGKVAQKNIRRDAVLNWQDID